MSLSLPEETVFKCMPSNIYGRRTSFQISRSRLASVPRLWLHLRITLSLKRCSDALLYRCVIAAAIGYDILPIGIPGLGVKRLHALIDEKKPIDSNALIDILIAAKKGPRAMEAALHVVIDALMCDPCNTIELSTEEEAAEGSNYQDSIRYMFPPPESLDKYLGALLLQE
jgi:hypothetical protein